ncbi:aromatic alcohol reductase [Pseudomonas petrae]|uniref:Aromatic alcohol reductase n=1 Tax=Pseudomonas petrae TaxID=2912190 RepID=A0ABS9I4L9_9PSED|nr:aromatic alcohol reductase [Pseudomonas petrae]MCF7532202.1 aromatic alcohol reductase [Pseudomonas petrae]MCF7535832.1 aromatic alcohol reductase [Pseudomonas petrae]MCF7542694.1 aromatic alcohol reductase [Pseudomonas petrae]
MQADISNVKQHILVLGAGELGLAVLRGLAVRADESASISVLLRQPSVESASPEKQKEIAAIRSLGAAIEVADIADASVDELAAVLGRFDTVISCVGFGAGRGTQRKLTQAALASGVKRYIPWQFGVDYDVVGRGSPQDLFDEQLDVRDLLRTQSRTEWLIISTGMFTSFLFDPAFGVVDLPGGRVNALGSLDTAVTVTTPEDIGTLTAAIVLHSPRFINQVVYTAGETLTYADLADLLERVTGRTFERRASSVPQLLAALEEMPDDNLRKYRAVFAMGHGVAWDVTQTFNDQQGIAVTDAEGWARAHLARG